uniref:Tyrosine-protein phosphatase domain-containing protein n=1 Tax=Macrostomum lignano TaxID=282301 RepID=A0A1I8F1J3_9PLAT
MLRDSELEVHRQFEEIKEAALEREQKDFSLNVATADCNRAKNRYTDILPYDHTRGPGHAPDDYINANYIKGLDREREFIASQGPIQGTIDDHWRMIYQHTRNQTEPLLQVVQLFYLGWADYNVPNVDDLADFLAQMRSYAPKVEAKRRRRAARFSAGVGRTGTLIALDILVRSLELRGAKTINVFETVMQLRACRKLMVQTKGQLAFIYRFMINYLRFA